MTWLFSAHITEKLAFSLRETLKINFQKLIQNSQISINLSQILHLFIRKDQKNVVENYRPILYTCVCSKIITIFLDENRILSKSQYIFRSRQSTCTQLIHCTNFWTSCSYDKYSVDVDSIIREITKHIYFMYKTFVVLQAVFPAERRIAKIAFERSQLRVNTRMIIEWRWIGEPWNNIFHII